MPSHPFLVASAEVVEEIYATGDLLPSIYLRRGARLRCIAVRGYSQILDGLRVGHSVAGNVVTSGQPVILGHAVDRDDFLAAVDDLESEVCLPLRHDATVVGVLNVEAKRPMTPVEVGRVRLWAAQLEAVLHQHGPPPPTPAQLLARHAEAIVAATSQDSIKQHLMDAGLQLSGMSSAALVLRASRGDLHVEVAVGPLAPPLTQMGAAALDDVLQWVSGASAASTHDPLTSTWLHSAALQRIPLGSMAVVALRAREQALGMLMCADAMPIAISTDVTEVLEVLGSLGASALATTSSMADLRRQALHDPLTGLKNRAQLEADMDLVLSDRRGQPVALLAIDVDRFKDVNDRLGHAAGDRLLTELAGRMQESLRDSDLLYRLGGDEFAALVDVNDERDAHAVGERLCAAARAAGTSISVGVVVTRPDDAVTFASLTFASLMVTADDALYAVKRGGRDGVAVGSLTSTPTVSPSPEG